MEEISRNLDNIIGAETEKFRTNRCQLPLGVLDYASGDGIDCEGCLLVEHVASLFGGDSGEIIMVPTGYAHRGGFAASVLKSTVLARDESKQVCLMCRRNYRNRPSAPGVCVAQIISQNLQCICEKLISIPQDMIMCGPTSSLYACVDGCRIALTFANITP